MQDNKKQLIVSLDYKTLAFVLLGLYLVTLGVMLYLWQPWNVSPADARKITVTGESTIQSEPDEFQFNPTYNITSDTKDGAIQEATDKSTEVVAELKKLGVEDKDIKINGYSNNWYWYYDEDDKNHTSVNITVTINDKDQAQEVQDYLLTTEPEGQITPWPTFSESKSKELETQARAEAVADAKSKAQASADELEIRVGKVISVNEGNGFGDYPIAYAENDIAVGLESVEVSRSIPIQPGEDEFRYSVTVVFELK